MRIIVFAMVLSCAHSQALSSIIFVDLSAKGVGNGTSWKDAFTSMQPALQAASTGDEIWIARGEYVASDSGLREVAFRLKDGISLYGGFSGVEYSLDQRDWIANETILSGNIGDPSRRIDNSYRIIEAYDLSIPARIDGLTITAARNDRSGVPGQGGGVHVLRCEIVCLNCRFVKNVAFGGGAIWVENGVGRLDRCDIKGNKEHAVVGYANSLLVLHDSTLRRNRAKTYGGALATVDVITEAVGCRFAKNVSARDGGAYYGTGEGRFFDCSFVKNVANEWGGGLRQWDGGLTVIGGVFYGNRTSWWAAGLSALGESTIINSEFYGNVGQRRKGEDAQLSFFETEPFISNTLVEGWTGRWGGEGNFDADPQWIDAGGGNLRIAGDSPCVDAGDNDAVTQSVDLDGNPRILGGRVDIGAYENVCREVLDLAATVVEDDAEGHSGDGDGVCESGEDCLITATVSVNAETLPAGSTVRVTFTPVDEDGHPDADPCCAEHTCGPGARCPTVRKARIDSAGQGTATATLRACSGGRTQVCIEGCGESLCREVECP